MKVTILVMSTFFYIETSMFFFKNRCWESFFRPDNLGFNTGFPGHEKSLTTIFQSMNILEKLKTGFQGMKILCKNATIWCKN